jgi:hypothetical protein
MLLGVLRLRRFSDAPLALLIGTPAKRVKEKGVPSLKHPFARVFPHYARFAAGELKVGVVRVFPPATESLPGSARSSWVATATSFDQV